MTEAQIVSQIIKWLKKLDECWAWKIVAHPRQRSGIPDVLCVFRGMFVAFEVKRPGKEGNVTELQQYALDKIIEARGEAHVVSSLQQVKGILRELEREETRTRSKGKGRSRC